MSELSAAGLAPSTRRPHSGRSRSLLGSRVASALVCLSLLCLAHRPLHAESGDHQDIVFIAIDEDTKDLFESEPPSALDLATFLLNLKKHRPSGAAVAAPWQWPTADASTLRLLARQIEGLPFVYGLVLELDEEAPASEEELSPFCHPNLTVQISAKSDAPRFSRIALQPHHRLLETKPSFGFLAIDFGTDPTLAEDGLRVPLLARGPHDQWMASLSLVLACQALGVPWEKVDLEIPGQLRLGSSPEPLTLDATGSILLPLESRAVLTKVSGTQINPIAIDGAIDPLPEIEGHTVILGDDYPEARGFQLPDGTAISRAEVIGWTAQAIVTLATTVKPPSAPEPAIEADPDPEPVLQEKEGETRETTPVPPAARQGRLLDTWWAYARAYPTLMLVVGTVLFVILMLFLMMRSISRASPYQPKKAVIEEAPLDEADSKVNAAKTTSDSSSERPSEAKASKEDEKQEATKNKDKNKGRKKPSDGDSG